MSAIAFLGTAALTIVIDTAWVALFRAKAVGKFRVVRDGTSIFQFESDLGSFSILPREGKLQRKSPGTSETIEGSEIKGLEFRSHESVAVLQELFFGLDGTDLLARYLDTVDWFSLAVVTTDGRRIPLFLSGQYNRREFLMTWYIELQAALLERLGLLTDVEQQSRDAMVLIRAKLGGPPLL